MGGGEGAPTSSALSPASDSPTPSHHPETPQRIKRIMHHLEELGLAGRCLALPARPATDAELLTCHRSDPCGRVGVGPQSTQATLGAGAWACLYYVELLRDTGEDVEGTELPGCPIECPLCASSAEHVDRLRATEKMKTRELHREGASYDSIYICPSTFTCAQLAAGAACRLVEAVLAGEVPALWGGDLGLQERKSWGWRVGKEGALRGGPGLRKGGMQWEEIPAHQRPGSWGSTPSGMGATGLGAPSSWWNSRGTGEMEEERKGKGKRGGWVV